MIVALGVGKNGVGAVHSLLPMEQKGSRKGAIIKRCKLYLFKNE